MMEPEQFCGTMAAEYASRRDLKLTATRIARAKNFQKCYQRLIFVAGDYDQVLKQVVERSAIINYEHRMTGNGVISVVEEILKLNPNYRRLICNTRWMRLLNRRC